MVIAHNMSAMHAQRQFGINTKNSAKTAEKLSSGYKINRSADDAAGLAISEKMRYLINGLERGSQNIEEGISLVQTADGALEEVIQNLQRVRELSIAALNETNSKSDIDAMQAEVDQILTEIDRIGETTTFNSKEILQGHKVRFVGKIPDREETYIEEVRYAREIPDWLWNASSHSMNYGNHDGNVSIGVDVGVMYKTVPDSTSETGMKVEYYGPQILNPEHNAEWTGENWTEDLDNNASAKLDFSALASMDTTGELYGALVDLLGVKLAYPCGTCGDSRSCVNFIGKVEGLPFTVYDGNKKETTSNEEDPALADREENVDLTIQKFSYELSDGTVLDVENGYFNAIDDLSKRHETETGLTDVQKNTEVENLARAIAKDLTTQVFHALSKTSEGHFDRVIRNQKNPDYSMIIFDYRDKERLTTEQKAIAPVISSIEGYIVIPEEKTRIIEGESLFATEGIMIVAGTEYEKSIELTLPKITLEELGIVGYRLGVEYQTEYSYEYGDAAKEKLKEAMTQYVKAMEEYEIEYQKYQQKLLERESTATLKEIEIKGWKAKSSLVYVDGHKTYSVSYEPYTSKGYEKNYTQPEPKRPIEPKKPTLEDFKAYAKVTEKKMLLEDTLDPIDNALAKVLKARSTLGAQQNRLEHAYDINRNTHENTQAAQSRIRDTDMGKEVVKHSKNNILIQVGQAMMAQANQSTQGVMNLL